MCCFIKRTILIIFFATTLSSCAKNCSKTPLAGMFYQPWSVDLNLEEEEWDQYMSSLHQAGIKTLYIQWLKRGNADFINQKSSKGVYYPSIILDAARDHNIEVYFGLYSDPKFFKAIQQNELQVNDYLELLLPANIEVAKNFMNTVGPHPAMKGWYLNEEIDDANWQGERGELIKTYINNLTHQLSQVSSLNTYYISTFYRGHQNPKDFGRFLNEIIIDSPVTVLIQDGFGVSSENMPYKVEQYNQLINEFSTIGKTGWIVELFNNNNKAGAFEGVAASYQELKIRTNYIPKKIPKKNVAGFSLRYWKDQEFNLANLYHADYCQQ